MWQNRKYLRQQDSRTAQRFSADRLSRFLDEVIKVVLQTVYFEQNGALIFQNQSVKPHYSGKAFVGQNLTHRPKLLCGGKSVQVALRHKFPIGAIVGNLFGNLRLFLFGKFAYIQFVTERACASHVVASLRRKSASRLVVGTNRVMRRHCALRIAKGSTLLNECSAIGVCVVACPDLRKIVQHCTVETASSAAAPFHQHVGEALRQFLCQRIHAQNISVRHFA